MDSDPKTAPAKARLQRKDDSLTFCWKEMLDQAFMGWEPTDQALERLIDRSGRAQ